ncbi:MAG: hypothetical protein ACI93R_003101 [Flavobacteriales bacterium]|jgi:hypothetical protein
MRILVLKYPYQIDEFWVLEQADLPLGFKAEPDRDKKGHYFPTVTDQMMLKTLVQN